MAEIYETENLAEALLLAEKFIAEKKYNLFRGQAQDWKVIPTLGRIPFENITEVKEKLERLYYFFETDPTLRKFNLDVDWFYAIAQHYGLPTNYIDFSSSLNVAAYFATNSNSNIVGKNCSIICLDENDFNTFIKSTNRIYINDKVIAPYIARVDVDNLWRLQAQKGCFLFTPYNEIEFFYDFDKIVFPFENSFEALTKKEIYPERKSELEILLDQYFNAEDKLKGSKRLQKFAEEMKIPITRVSKMNFENVLKQNKKHQSWKPKETKKWHFEIKEEWNNSNKELKIPLTLILKKDTENQIELLIKELSEIFKSKNIIRTTPLEFEIIAKPKFTNKKQKIINRSITRIWDGTRNLPYSDQEIFKIIGNYICLEAKEIRDKVSTSKTGENLILLEMTNEYGSTTRFYASPSKIISAFRDDLKDILIDELTVELTSEILLHINKPEIVFNFESLIEIFKDEIIAYQVFQNSEKDNPVIFYTPSQIRVLGYA